MMLFRYCYEAPVFKLFSIRFRAGFLQTKTPGILMLARGGTMVNVQTSSKLLVYCLAISSASSGSLVVI